MEQRIYLDENSNLVVETNNATFLSNSIITSNIEGDFVVSEEDVRKLMALINDTTVKHNRKIHCFTLPFSTNTVFIPTYYISNKMFIPEMKEIKEKVDFLINENNELHRKIADFNASRRPWERKFNLE